MIKRLILHIIANAATLYITVQLLKGDFLISGGWKGYLIAAVLFGFLNSVAKPVLKVLALPFVFLSAGLFIFVINMFLVWFGKYALDVLKFEGIAIQVQGGWVTYLYVGLILSLVNIVINWLLKD